MREDYGTHTEADAGAFAAAHAERPSRLELARDAGFEPDEAVLGIDPAPFAVRQRRAAAWAAQEQERAWAELRRYAEQHGESGEHS